MAKNFEIIDGVIYVDKSLFREAQLEQNNISRLTGSCCSSMFETKPTYRTGIDSITIDYSQADHIHIDGDPDEFIEELCNIYHNKVRGHIVIEEVDNHHRDITINNY